MVDTKETILREYPNIISYQCTKKISEQMGRNICTINIGKNQGTGFFCKIPFPNQNNMLPVFITNNHVINSDLLYKDNSKILLDIKEEDDIKEINLNKNRMKYTNEKFDITIIEIKPEDNINYYLELDEVIINDILNNKNKTVGYINETVYIMQYPDNKLSVSYGILDTIYEDEKYNFIHKCNTKGGSSGSPILNINNNKIIGIHKGSISQYNVGTFLNYPIKEFIELNYKNNEILLKKFNDKYDLDISDTKIKEIYLSERNLGYICLNDLCEIEFKELKELNLSNNNISDIKAFEKAKFDNLEILNLNCNQIWNLKILEKVNFKQLSELYLSSNFISDIEVFENAKFDKLEILVLDNNQISDINVFEKVKFKELKELSLLRNNISNIKVFEKAKFDKLETLDLRMNQISTKVKQNRLIIIKLKNKIKNFKIDDD